MNLAEGIQRALAYVETHLEDDFSLEEAARQGAFTAYQLQRIFSLLSGMSLGEYIRARRMTLAAADLKRGERVIDTAVRYGYASPDSFARAFFQFHGLPPSEARASGMRLNACSPLHIQISLTGGCEMDYQIEKKQAMKILGFHRHFTGTPDDRARFEQEEKLFVSTRAHQWLLQGMQDLSHPDQEFVVMENLRQDGYEFWYGVSPDDWTLNHLYDPGVTGIDFMDRFGFEVLEIPAGNYAVFRTPCSRKPVVDYEGLRKRIAGEWLPATGYALRDAPEVAVYHWKRPKEKREQRFIEIWLPVE